MPPQSWADEEQAEFLQSYFDQYYELQKDGKYTDFWATVLEAWFTRWPALATQFPGKQAAELTDEECATLKATIKSTKGRIKMWYRWRVNPKAKAGRRGRRLVDVEDIFDLGGSGGTRRLKEHEMFSRMYYKEKVQPIIQDELQHLEASGNGVKKEELINYVKSRTKEIYDAQPDDIKAEVRAAVEEHARSLESPDDDSEPTPEQFQAAIDACPDVLTRFLKALAKKTGWAYSILLGGPDPRGNGQISSASMHIGETEHNANFSHVYPEFKTAVLEPYTEFLKTLYPESVRSARSLKSCKAETSVRDKNVPQEDLDQDAEGEPDPDMLPPLRTAHKKNDFPQKKQKSRPKPSSPTVETPPVGTSKNVPPATTLVPFSVSTGKSSSPTVETPPAASTDIPPSTPLAPSSVSTGKSSSPTVETPPAASTDIPPSTPLAPSSVSTGKSSSPTVETPPATSADIPPTTALAPSSASTVKSSYVNQQVPEVRTLTLAGFPEYNYLNQEPQVNNFNDGFDPLDLNNINWEEFNQQKDLYLGLRYDSTPLPYQNVLPPAVPSTILSTSFEMFNGVWGIDGRDSNIATQNAAGPGNGSSIFHISSSNSAPHAQPRNDGLSHLLALPSSTPFSDNAQLVASSSIFNPHAQTPSAPMSTDTPDPSCLVSVSGAGGAPISTMPKGGSNAILGDPNPISIPPSAFSIPISKVPAPALASTTQPLAPSATESRRSGRALVPSKRTEQMNMIGSKKVTLTSSATENVVPGQRPEWVNIVKTHLLECDLGPEWASCVEAWLIVEEQLGFGTVPGSKGSLPMSRRPAEWGRWVSKAKNGMRAYNSMPDLMDPAEFGIAVQKWWWDIQPSFRKCDSLMPAAIFVNPTPCGDSDDWKDLRKGGQNGLVSLLIILLWWGRGLAKRTQWQDDSSPQWKATVMDVSRCLGTVGASSLRHNSKKRKVEHRKEVTKRARLS